MRYPFFGVLVLAAGVGCLPASAGQAQTGEPAPQVQQPGGTASNDGGYYPQGAAPLGYSAPATLTMPAGTLITVRTTEMLSSDQNRPGDAFTAVLEQPLVAQGWVLARRGQVVQGRVASAQKAGRVKGVSQLAVELSEVVLVDGQQVPLRTQLVQSTAGTSQARDVGGVGAATGIGAIIGAAAGGGEGAAIGAAAGAAAGVAGILSTRGRATEIYPESVLTFRLEAPVVIDTSQSQQAFRAVTAADYNDQGVRRNPPRYRAVETYPPRPYYPPPYYYYGYPYPPAYFGFYYGYGFGPRYYAHPRVFFGRGYHWRH